MKGYEMRFNVYAESQEEADKATESVKRFISDMAKKGIAVRADRISSAIKRWSESYLVTNYFK